MRKLLLSLLALFCSIVAKAEDKSLIITFSDNTTQTFVLSALPQITMANNKMTISVGSTTAEYDLYKIKTFTFSGTTGIENIENNSSIIAEGDRIIIEGANPNVRIFSVDGKTATLKTTSLSNSTIIDISSLGRGVYIIKANDKTLKISKK
ncbi:T9SS type A sorting domain-containing protein [Prevotella sp.]|uniref:T9SS type A sorting domain-containing protein n=1 Tax=Prevotella sp. TaxID=59823 RepID=UPI003DA57CC3